MASPKECFEQVLRITSDMIEVGLCDDQNFPALKRTPRESYITTSVEVPSLVLRNIPYGDLYAELRAKRSFNIKMLDGALIQIQYAFCDEEISKHRLAFFPTPDLSEYQNNPDIYEADEVYADIIAKSVVASPIRFDFDREAFVEDTHPMSHLTIGQYKNCRIPVSGPITPFLFVHFVLRSFYNTAYRKCSDQIRKFEYKFEKTIVEAEGKFIHVQASA